MIALELRPELQPPVLDQDTVHHLATLAAQIDGAHPGQWEDALAEFNSLAETTLTFADFQGIYGGEEHATWVRRILIRQRVRAVPGVTHHELVEIARRAMPAHGDRQSEAFMAILDANVPRPAASNLIFYAPDYDVATNTWGGGRPMGEYDPTPEQVVDWALSHPLAATSRPAVRNE